MEAIPILLFIAPSWILAALYFFLSLRPHLNSPQLAQLNRNLAKAGLYWSNSDGGFRALTAGNPKQDTEHAFRSFWMMTALLSLMSLIGTVILFLIFISGHPRLERNAMRSALASDPELNTEQVTALVEELKATV